MEQSKQSVDIVIVGCGPSSVGILYGLLKKQSNISSRFSIAVMEQGAEHSNSYPNTVNPQRWYQAAHFDSAGTIQNATIPQSKLHNRILEIPTGTGFGGGSNINACLFIPPSQTDFDAWPGIWKKGTKILSALKEIEHVMRVNNGLCDYETNKSYFQACCSSHDIPLPCEKRDFTLDDEDGIVSNISLITKYPMTVNNKLSYRRVNYFESLIKPILASSSSKIQFISGVKVQRLLLSNGKVTGIEYYANKTYFSIQAKLQVILCTGAIITPALLMASGIGDTEALKKAGISPLISVPAVGETLRDHIVLPRIYLSTSALPKPRSWNSIQAWYNLKIQTFQKTKHIFQFQFTDGGVSSPFMISHFIASVLFRRHYSFLDLHLALQHLFLQLFYFTRWILFYILSLPPFYYIITNHIVTLNICLMNPQSNGCISVSKKSKTNSDVTRLHDLELHINPDYLSSYDDVKSLHKGYKISTIISNHHLKSCIEVLPNNVTVKTKLQRILLSEMVLSYYHYCGTCPMSTTGKYDNGVVNDKLQVHNIQNLRICDASIFPFCISVPTASTCVAIGLVFSDIFIEELNSMK